MRRSLKNSRRQDSLFSVFQSFSPKAADSGRHRGFAAPALRPLGHGRGPRLLALLLLLPLLVSCASARAHSPRLSINHAPLARPASEDSGEGEPDGDLGQRLSIIDFCGGDFLVPFDTSQVMIIAASESGEANLLLYSKQSQGWELELGPRYCRLGSLRPAGTEDRALLGRYSPAGRLTDGDGYCLELAPLSIAPQLGSEPGEGLFLRSAREGAEDEGCISMDFTVLHALFSLIDECGDWVLLLLSAEELGWELEPEMPSNFVYAAEAIPGIYEDARYAGSDNFTGNPLPGYFGDKTVVSIEVASCLYHAQTMLSELNLGLLIWDGYRPRRATERMIDWANEPEDYSTKMAFYPNITKADILSLVYVAAPSTHSQGVAVDLTLVDLDTGRPLDMGGGFDYFDSSASYFSTKVTDEQKANRRLLRETMIEAGFRPYNLEWWHFSVPASLEYSEYLDFPIAK